MKKEHYEPWIDVYNKFRRHLRFLLGGLALLAFTAFIDGIAYVDQVSDRYQLAVDLILKERREGTLRDEISATYSNFGKSGEITIDMKDISPLYRQYIRTLDARSREKVFNIGNVGLKKHPYVLILLCGPLFLVVAMIWPLLSIRKLHRRLKPVAEPEGTIQQKLNSLFFDRVTTHYGESWRSHVLTSLVGVFVLAIATPFMFISSRQFRADLSIKVNTAGEVFPKNDDPLNAIVNIVPNEFAAQQILILAVLTLLAVGVIARISLSVPHQADKEGKHDNE